MIKAKLIFNVSNPYYGNVEGAFSRVVVEKDLNFDPMYNKGDKGKFIIDVEGSNNPNKEYNCEVRQKEVFTNTNTQEVVITYNITEV